VAATSGAVKFDLTLSLSETPRGLAGSLDYVADLFEAATIQRMAGSLQVLLEGIARDPSRRVFELPLLPAAEREQVLVAWNRTAAEIPRDATAHALFEAQAARTPEAVAVVADGRALRYGELDEHAGRLARWLRARGVRPGILVGVCTERSIEAVVGMLGVLK